MIFNLHPGISVCCGNQNLNIYDKRWRNTVNSEGYLKMLFIQMRQKKIEALTPSEYTCSCNSSFCPPNPYNEFLTEKSRVYFLTLICNALQRCIQNTSKHLRWSYLRKWLTTESLFSQKFHLRCLTGFWIRLCFSKSCEGHPI